MRSIFLHRPASRLCWGIVGLGLATSGLVFADESGIETRHVPTQIIGEQIIVRGSSQPTYPGKQDDESTLNVLSGPSNVQARPVPVDRKADAEQASEPVTLAAEGIDRDHLKFGLPPSENRGWVNFDPLNFQPPAFMLVDATIAVTLREMQTRSGIPAKELDAKLDAKSVRSFPMKESPPIVVTQNFPKTDDTSAAGEPAAVAVHLPTSGGTNFPVAKPVVVRISNAMGAEMATVTPKAGPNAPAATTKQRPASAPPIASTNGAKSGGISTTPLAETRPLRVARVEPPTQPVATASPKVAEFNVKEGDHLSDALRQFLQLHNKRLQWNTRADFMIEHPYRVSTNSLVDTLSVVLKEYRLSATLFQGNDVIEVFMNNGELGNEIDK